MRYSFLRRKADVWWRQRCQLQFTPSLLYHSLQPPRCSWIMISAFATNLLVPWYSFVHLDQINTGLPPRTKIRNRASQMIWTPRYPGISVSILQTNHPGQQSCRLDQISDDYWTDLLWLYWMTNFLARLSRTILIRYDGLLLYQSALGKC